MPADPIQESTFTPIERRVLAYLDQRGGKAHRRYVVADLSAPDSHFARFGGNGSNGAAPLIMGKWCARLIKMGLVRSVTGREGYYEAHIITQGGREALRHG